MRGEETIYSQLGVLRLVGEAERDPWNLIRFMPA